MNYSNISAHRQNFKNPLGNFFGINLCKISLLASFKTERGVWGDVQMDDMLLPSMCEIYCCENS